MKMTKYYVYVINLDNKVLNIEKFKEKNPDYIEGKPCVYVGQSFHKPKIRFEQHLNGYKANKYVKKFGNFLRMTREDITTECHFFNNPYFSRESVEKEEVETAERLRKKGYGVWSN